ncbi:ABC transporter permease [Pseudoponticoccus marisrubri]|uniref:Spermidine/putrescine ABC transporter permease n=1 Tax=Pseudoponticoccus marisrubri TaxID=1685382 RepID=A0A0W7WKD8_9RHOB|nr:ABC transporter permease subunit [Pseudoponticoccus marisrubri]KUF10952.1 spermidine/putrescine ABC transporter permease [Pseudoponticoccus marisrubri]
MKKQLQALWLTVILVLLYVPILSVILASLANTRYMRFPHRNWSIGAYTDAFSQQETLVLHLVSLKVAALVTLLALVLATLGAMAFARYDWRGRSIYQKAVVLPIFFPQPVLGLALLLFFSALGITPSWKTAVFAHLVWILPIVTLVISIRLFGYDPAQEDAARDLGATRLQTLREVTLPHLAPGLISGGLFAFLLSWSNLPLSIFTTGADTTLPEWLFSRVATNYAPVVSAIAVIGTLASVLFGLVVLAALWMQRRAARQSSSASASISTA